MKNFIYGLADPRCGEIRYVGKTNNPAVRYKPHRAARVEGNGRLRAWLQELKVQSVLPEMRILETVDDESWRQAEKKWIEELRAQGADLFNLVAGGGGVTLGCALPRTQETRKKISEAKKIWCQRNPLAASAAAEKMREAASRDPNFLHKISVGVRRAHATTDLREKQRLAHVGLRHSAKTKRNIGISQERAWKDPAIRARRLAAMQASRAA